MVQPLTVLSIAGSDSGGGAGIQADLRTFAALGVHATTAVTAVTAQDTMGVHDVEVMSASMVLAQARCVLGDFEVAAVKTGMLGDASVVEAVAELAREGLLNKLVVDPVLVSTTEHSLMRDGGVRAYREALVPLATVVTPNLREAATLCGVDVEDVTTIEHMRTLAREILALGPRFVLVKGGHFAARRAPRDGADLDDAVPDDAVPDVLVGHDVDDVLEGPRVLTTNDHGTGCSLSAALCARLATGRSVPDATREAKAFVLTALRGARDWRLGEGRGPLDHLGWNQ